VIRTNLSTRPFYNLHAVRVIVGALAILVLAITAFNVVQIVRLTMAQRTLGAQASAAEQEAARLRRDAVQILARVDTKELETVAKAAREANAIIDERTFSWTEVFAHFEEALPEDVRITSVQQQPGSDVVMFGAEARSIDDLDVFIEALERTGAFRDVIALSEVQMENNVIDARLSATYMSQQRAGTAP
jgi:hypothetical protein